MLLCPLYQLLDECALFKIHYYNKMARISATIDRYAAGSDHADQKNTSGISLRGIYDDFKREQNYQILSGNMG